MEFKENQQIDLPNGSKLHCWINDSDLSEKGILTLSNEQNIGKNIEVSFEQNMEIQKCNPSHVHYYPMRIPPFMYTFMVSLIWECKSFESKIYKIRNSISQLFKIFNTTNSEQTRIDVNEQIILYDKNLSTLCKNFIKVKINLFSAQNVIKQISIVDHKDLLVKSAKHFCSLSKQNPWNPSFKEIHRLISLEIKYVNHYEFHDMEEFKI